MIRPRYVDLFEALCDPDPERVDRAFDAVLFDRGSALPDLVECYLTAPHNPKLRYLMIQLLGFTEDKRATEVVVQALNDRHPIVRAEACRSLEDLHARQHQADLEARLDDVDDRVRDAASEALQTLGLA